MNENHVPTHETCEKLKEKGFPQGTAFQWRLTHDPLGCPYVLPSQDASLGHMDYAAAPLLSEILEQFKHDGINVAMDTCELGPEGEIEPYIFDAIDIDRPILDRRVWHTNPAEAAALLWLKVKEK